MTSKDADREFPRKERPAKSPAAPLKHELNQPVPLDEFDQEHMGLAAKE